jgi:predicted transcriptional regulator
MNEKRISEITVRLSETLKRDLQDVAAAQDRTLSDTIRIALEVYLYGMKHRTDEACGRDESGQTLRGKAGA